MLIRRLMASDISILVEMATHVEGFHVSKETTTFWSQDQLERWIGTGEDVLLGAEIDGKLVGFVLTAHHRPTGKVTWENHFVLPEYRHEGVGKALIDEMRKCLKENGATYLHFLVKKDNAESSEYYERRGFSKGFDFEWFDENL